MNRLNPQTTAVIIVDVQERLASAMPEEQLGQVIRSTRILVEGARILGAPVFVTEQYPRGLGPTLPEVKAVLEASQAQPFEKTQFSAYDTPGFGQALEATQAQTAIVIGMEAHVCVFQTVRDLVNHGMEVQVPIDGVSSRREDHRSTGLELCSQAGAIRTTSESVVFDWLREAGSQEFKDLSKLIR